MCGTGSGNRTRVAGSLGDVALDTAILVLLLPATS